MNRPREPTKQAIHVAQEIEKVREVAYSDTKSYGEQQKSAVGPTKEIKMVKRELLARKVGSKIDQLVSQLFEENTQTRISN